MNLLYYSLAIYLSLTPSVSAASSKKESTKTPDKPCTIVSPYSGSFFDLTSLEIPDPATSRAKKPRTYSYNATGWDLPYNFTANVCGPVVEKMDDVVGLERDLWRNVSAYYKHGGKTYALGLQNSEFVMRGRKLVLNYTGGSPCDSATPKSTHSVHDLRARELIDPDKKKSSPSSGSGSGSGSGGSSSVRRKSMIVSMLCDKDPLAPPMALSFVATPDECTYFFEGRSNAACATANTSKGNSLNPGGVFGVIVLIALIVYFVGGCVYNRAVLQQRGWQQVPNYSLWSGIFGFFKDLFIIMTSSCARFLPSRRGYSRVNGGIGGLGSRGGRGRSDSDAENRLIDELNEEWED